ncbi:hypothetical protein [Asanoa iriomotensis]|uniref:S-adenosyl methyltransferase n=1 Tax=Asanoa iriomotensis TaxID=234613 RepID=A0ABQ4C940_9ACTN|nr:hypothetical protein [Asanoa iriomotensis]GIF59259.1 hypothetical protein Air01nite_53540 [Asanoa iriomotensis]
MAAHDRTLPTTSTDPAAAPKRVAAPDDKHKPAPVIVWRTTSDDTDATGDCGISDSPLTPRLAHLLVAIYSDVHGTIVDLDADDALRDAAETAGRRYLAVTDLAELPTSPESPQATTLIVLRWPRPAADPSQDANNLLSACQQHLATDGSAIVAVTAAATGQPGTPYAEHEQFLLTAAQAAGLHHLHDIVPLPAIDGRDTFTYTTTSGTAPDHHSHADAMRPTTSTTLVIFGHPGRRP